MTRPPAPPTYPAEARGTSLRSAKAFVRYYVATQNRAGESGNTAMLRRLSTDRCVSCSGISDKIDRVYADDGYFKGDGWAVRRINGVEPQPHDEPILRVEMAIASQSLLERQGASVRHFDGGKQPMIFGLVHSGRWRVTRMDLVL